MTRYMRLSAVVLLLASPVFAQTQPTIDDLLKQMESLGAEAAKLRKPPVVVDPPAGTGTILTTEQLQIAINAAKPDTTILLEPGVTYRSIIIPANVAPGLTITTRNCGATNRLVTPADAPLMATLRGDSGQNYGLLVLGSKVTLTCFLVSYNAPLGQGEMLRCGDSTDKDITHVPSDVTVKNMLFMGNPGDVYGQKRAIAANCRNMLIDQVWCQDVWVNGQDSSCVGVWSTPGPVMVRRVVLSAGSENMIIGGTPPASPAHIPEDVTLEDSVLWKPLAWKGHAVSHAVKNLFEIKLGHRITARRNWMENHWQAAQPGPAVVLTMATNGACGWCDGKDWLFENNVVWNVAAGISITGYQYGYAPGAGPAVGIVIRNNLFKISKAAMGGNGRPVQVSNEPKDVTLDHNTFLHDGNAIVAADYGIKWPFQDPPLPGPIKAGPLAGFLMTNNATQAGSYAIFTPDGTNGTNVTTYFPGLVVSGNVLAGAAGSTVTRLNAFGGGSPNTGPSVSSFVAAYGPDGCPASPQQAGADCSTLPFGLRSLVPR